MAYLVMEYLPGITLRELLKDYKKLTPEQTVDIMDAVLSGLAAAHKAGIVHRDLKPENVLLADDGRIKLGDFGLARAASANTGTGQALLGTIAYLSPELVTRGVADARSDIYAVGIMMYEMLTGEQPYVGEAPMQIAYQHANDTVPTPSSKNPGRARRARRARAVGDGPRPRGASERRPRHARSAARGGARHPRVAHPAPHAGHHGDRGCRDADRCRHGRDHRDRRRRRGRTRRCSRRARGIRRAARTRPPSPRRPLVAGAAATGSSPSCSCSPGSPRAPAGTSAPAPARSRPYPRPRRCSPTTPGRCSRPRGSWSSTANGTTRVVPAGQVSGTDPAGGQQARRGSDDHDVRVARAAHAARPRRRRTTRGRRACGPRRVRRRGAERTAVLGRHRRRLGDRRARRRRQSPRRGVPRARRRHPGGVGRSRFPMSRACPSPRPRRRSPARAWRSAGPSPSSATRCRSTT